MLLWYIRLTTTWVFLLVTQHCRVFTRWCTGHRHQLPRSMNNIQSIRTAPGMNALTAQLLRHHSQQLVHPKQQTPPKITTGQHKTNMYNQHQQQRYTTTSTPMTVNPSITKHDNSTNMLSQFAATLDCTSPTCVVLNILQYKQITQTCAYRYVRTGLNNCTIARVKR